MELFKARPGWVYILTNPHPAMKGIVKIGMTSRCPEHRAAELASGSGLPTAFVVAWCAPVSDCRFVETAVHRMLANKRIRKRREFFRVDVETARSTIIAASGSLVNARRERVWSRPAYRPIQGPRYARSRFRLTARWMPWVHLATVALVAVAYFRPPIPRGVPWLIAEGLKLVEWIGWEVTRTLR